MGLNAEGEDAARRRMPDVEVADDRELGPVNDLDERPPVFTVVDLVHGLADQNAGYAGRGHAISWFIVAEEIVIGGCALIDDDGVLAVWYRRSAHAGNLGDAGVGVAGLACNGAC